MKKQGKRNEKPMKESQEERKIIHDFANAENVQPLPQPKDYEEIDY